MAEKLITKDDVCQLLAISHKTLDRIILDGSLPFYKVRGRYRFLMSDVEKYLAGCRQQWPSPADCPNQSKTITTRTSSSDLDIPMHYYPGMKVV